MIAASALSACAGPRAEIFSAARSFFLVLRTPLRRRCLAGLTESARPAFVLQREEGEADPPCCAGRIAFTGPGRCGVFARERAPAVGSVEIVRRRRRPSRGAGQNQFGRAMLVNSSTSSRAGSTARRTTPLATGPRASSRAASTIPPRRSTTRAWESARKIHARVLSPFPHHPLS